MARSDDLATAIERKEAERKARRQILQAKLAEAEARDELELGQIKGRKVLEERQEKARAQLERQRQQGGAPEPQEVMPPPSLNSLDRNRLDPSAMPPSAAVGGAGAQQVLSQLVGGGQQGPPTVGSSELEVGEDIVKAGPLGQPFSVPDVRQRFRQRELTPHEIGLGEKVRRELDAPLPSPSPSVALGLRNFSRVGPAPKPETLSQIQDDLHALNRSIESTGDFEAFRSDFETLQLDFLDMGQALLVTPPGFFSLTRSPGPTLTVPAARIEQLLQRMANDDAEAEKELRDLAKVGENEALIDHIGNMMLLRRDPNNPIGQRAIAESQQRRQQEAAELEQNEQLYQLIIRGQ